MEDKAITPARSTLYNIEPKGLGTKDVESLTSFIGRLAEAHCVRVSSLINKYIKPVVNASKEQRFLYDRHATSLNGFGEVSSTTVEVLQNLTKVSGLSQLTMMKFEHLISKVRLLKNHKAWCPHCLEEMKIRKQQIYEKLNWVININTYCSTHQVLLEDKCPVCCKQQPILTPSMRNGYCYSCHNWLGRREIIKEEAVTKYEVMIESTVSKMLKDLNKLNSSRVTLSESLLEIKERLFRKPKKTFCTEILKIQYSNYLHFINYNKHPSLNTIVKISIFFNLPIIDIVNKSIKFKECDFTEPFHLSPSNKKTIMNVELVRKQVEKMLDNEENFPISLQEVGAEVGFSYQTLTFHLPDLCNRIKQKNDLKRSQLSRDILQERYQKIKETIIEIAYEGKYPSYRSVKNRLPFTFYNFDEKYLKIWSETLNEYGIMKRHKNNKS